jgi:hypothetical protein
MIPAHCVSWIEGAGPADYQPVEEHPRGSHPMFTLGLEWGLSCTSTSATNGGMHPGKICNAKNECDLSQIHPCEHRPCTPCNMKSSRRRLANRRPRGARDKRR